MSYHVGFIPDGDGGGFFSFLQKSNSMLSPDELEVVGLLELQAFIEAKSVQLGEAFIDEDLLCMVSQFAPIVEDQVSHSPGTKTDTLWSTDIRRGSQAALYFCSCILRWRSIECASLPYFNSLPDNLAVMNCSVLETAEKLCSLQLHRTQQRVKRVRVK